MFKSLGVVLVWNLIRLLTNLVPALLRLVPLVMQLMGDRRVPGLLKLLVPLALIYVISPIDLIPDFIGGVGWIDDLIAIATAVMIFLQFSPKPVVEGYRRRGWGFVRPKDEPRDRAQTTIEGYYEVLEDEADRPGR